jgi:hypothetical protein
MGNLSVQGWLPAMIEFDPEPAVVTEAHVRWIAVGETPLAEPFYSHTVSKLQSGSDPAREIETSLETMIRAGARLAPIRPAGFIFHVSHCGSTLVANALKTVDGAVIASEPPPVARTARRYPDPQNAYLRARWARTQYAALDSLFRLLAHYRTGEPQSLVVKFASVNLMCMKAIRLHWPETPCVVLVRDPAEVMVTQLQEQGWMAWKSDNALAGAMFGFEEPTDSMADETYCALALRQLIAAALEAVGEGCKVIDYEDLNRKRIRSVADFFGLELTKSKAELDRVLLTYAKDPAGRIAFQSDRTRKRRQATSAVHEAAQRWVMPVYSELRGKGFW